MLRRLVVARLGHGDVNKPVGADNSLFTVVAYSGRRDTPGDAGAALALAFLSQAERRVERRLGKAVFAEFLGTFLLVFFGTGAVAASVLSGAQVGLWQVAVVWGFGVALAIYCTSAASGAHLNPAITLAIALWRPGEFAHGWILPYWGAQLLGGIAAGAAIAAVWEKFIERFELARGITRGAPGSELSAMVFGQYFPNPAIFGVEPAARALVTPFQALLVEMFGTSVLAFIMFALTDRRNEAGPGATIAPFFIGFTVAALISLFAPITQAGWNPARDLGPRLVSWLLGWGTIAIPGPAGGFWIYLAGPFVGAPVGATIYQLFHPEEN